MTQFLFETRATKVAKALNGVPTQESINLLKARGYTYDPRSRQWYLSGGEAVVIEEKHLESKA